MQAANNYEGKLKKLLDTCLTPNYQIQNDCYLNNLLSHLTENENKNLINFKSISKWMIQATSYWEINPPPTISITTFALNLLAMLSKDEAIFQEYCSLHIHKRIFTIFNIINTNIPSLKLAYVKVLLSFLKHKPGVEWIVLNSVWKTCLHFCLANQTLYIIREGHNFVYSLLISAANYDENFANQVIHEILSIFKEKFHSTKNICPEVEEEILIKRCSPTIKLLIFIFNNLLESDSFKEKDYQVAKLIIKQNLELNINKLIILTHNPDLLYNLYEIIYHIYFFELVINSKGGIFKSENLNTTCQKVLHIISSLINTNQIMNVVKLSHLGDYHWKFIKDQLPPIPTIKQNKQPYLFQNQLFVLQILPIFSVSFVHCDYNYTAPDVDDLRGAFLDSIFSMLCEDTIRMGFSWRRTLTSQVNAFENGKLTIMHALKNIKNYDKHRGIKTFQCFIYSLKDINDAIRKNPTKIELFTTHISYCITLLEGIAAFIKEFEITWRESVETICVTGCTVDFLNQPVWPPRVVVQGLKLINMSISKFLSPNMALLVEEKNDCTMKLLGGMLQTKLLDIHWEVRDSALEVICTIANISNSKYPFFRKLLLDLDIINMVLTMCTSDSERFVRSSALKCLQEMIQVPTFWSQDLRHQNLPEKIMDIFKNETEGIVRMEAASLMRCIYEYQSLPCELMGNIYESMALAATADLHWEVKKCSLDFWGKVILNHLQDQGFIDGKFPSVTFSKENRKIVALTENEIKQRLAKFLTQLSHIGCLSVLITAVKDDCDLEVAKMALVKIKIVTDVLKMYDFIPERPERIEVDSNVIDDAVLPTPPVNKIDLSNEVIDEIIGSSDINLLPNVFNPDYEIKNFENQKLETVSPEKFINFVQEDLDSFLSDKSEWLNNLDNLNSLLDDILKTYEDNVNTMDCY